MKWAGREAGAKGLIRGLKDVESGKLRYLQASNKIHYLECVLTIQGICDKADYLQPDKETGHVQQR